VETVLSVVVPVYNEEEVIRETHKRLSAVMADFGGGYEIIYVNDGSRDKSAGILAEICYGDKNARLINLSRNFGHQCAITAGLDYASGAAVVFIDADLQDPPAVILEMVKKWREGYDVVYGRRLSRKGETAFKKFTSKTYYRFLRKMTSVDIPADTGDFRLIDRKVADALKALPERNRYMRGLVSWVGFRQAAVDFNREERFSGTTKYPLGKMIKLAADGITAFSLKPLKLAMAVGVFFAFLAFAFLLFVVAAKITNPGYAINGWASMIAALLFTQGAVLVMLGVIGEYIGRIFEETKARPLYIVAETVNMDNTDNTDNSEHTSEV
jgi:dolichol-phosphate mannosyltransferase